MEEQRNSFDSPKERGIQVVSTQLGTLTQGRSLIVVIGINNYLYWQKLNNAVQDAIGLRNILIEKLGFSEPIPPLLNEAATKTAINSLIEDKLREELEENDNLVLFFAGHGHTRVDKVGGKDVGETGFIIPVEGRGPKEVWSDYIQIDPFLQSISRLPARHILVILDSCHSGFALGEAMKKFRDIVRYEQDLSSRISRKVVTSARREQLALDGGPIPGHSLFTGTLIDGFNWGKADLDGNGLITSSELGLFIQQRVGQTSESKQTPDFGSFYLDDRGEMVISLRNQSFDALKARALSALQRGEINNFEDLTQEIIQIKPDSGEALYLEYRLGLIKGDIKRALNSINKLRYLRPSAGTVPLSQNDLETLSLYLSVPAWMHGFSISESEFPFQLKFFSGPAQDSLVSKEEQMIGEIKGFKLRNRDLFQFKVENSSSSPLYIYLVGIDSAGRIEPIPIWFDSDETIDWAGLQGVKFSSLLRVNQDVDFDGICELRFFSSPKRIVQLLRPPGVVTRGSQQDCNLNDIINIRTKSIFYCVI